MKFTKMHGLGNDFIIFDAPPGGAPAADAIRRLADRFTGIGFDQALMLEPPRRPGTAVYYRIFNADGREVEQCGNGARCIARHIGEGASPPQSELVLDSPGGLVQARLKGDQVSVTMGVPDFDPASLPFEASGEAYVYPLTVGASEVEIGAVRRQPARRDPRPGRCRCSGRPARPGHREPRALSAAHQRRIHGSRGPGPHSPAGSRARHG